MAIMYHHGNRRLQDQFDSRRISDRLGGKADAHGVHRRRQGVHRRRDLFLHVHRCDPVEPAWKGFDLFKGYVHPRQPTTR